MRSADAKSPFKIQMLDTNLQVQEVIYEAATISKKLSEKKIQMLDTNLQVQEVVYEAATISKKQSEKSVILLKSGAFAPLIYASVPCVTLISL